MRILKRYFESFILLGLVAIIAGWNRQKPFRVSLLTVAGLTLGATASLVMATPSETDAATAILDVQPVFSVEESWSSLAALMNPNPGAETDVIHVLLLGVDRRGKERGRSDAIHLLRLSKDTVTLFSLPRDTRIDVPGTAYRQKLNHAYAYGGSKATVRVIEKMLDLKISGVLELDLQAFAEMMTLAETLTLKGKLIGAEELFANAGGLLSWLRNRSFPNGDLRRVQRHQLFLRKTFDWVLMFQEEHPKIFKISLAPARKTLTTDLTDESIVRIGNHYRNLRPQTAAADSTPYRYESIRTMERFILPGRPLLVQQDTSQAKTSGDEDFSAEDSDDTSAPRMVSYYERSDRRPLGRMIASWRRQGITSNYTAADTLLANNR